MNILEKDITVKDLINLLNKKENIHIEILFHDRNEVVNEFYRLVIR